MSLEGMHAGLGARWVEVNGLKLVRSYGDPAGEYAAARSACIVAERPDRSVIRIHGRDPVKMVQGLITNDLAGATETRAVYAAVLTPKGKMVADVRVLRRGAELLMDVDVRARDALVAHLQKFVPPLFARFELADDRWSVLTMCGPEARACVRRALGMEQDVQGNEGDVVTSTSEWPSAIVVATSQFGVDGFDILLPREDPERLWRTLVEEGARPAGHATLEVLRVEAGRPQWGRELDENTIPLEANLRERAISETKGCYTGQEVIVRILHRGHVNWLLRGVLLGSVPAAAQGTALIRREDGKQVGRITSSVWSPQHGQTIALGYVRREVTPGSGLALGDAAGTPAEVVELPFAAGSADAEPELQNDRR